MIKIEEVDIWGFKHAIRGMRNPMDSWDKSDSFQCDGVGCYFENCPEYKSNVEGCGHSGDYVVGSADLDLMHRFYVSGTEHRKFMRMIHVSMDVTAPLYWWKEYYTYKVGTVANSCSTMHKIHAKEFTLDDFSHEYLCGASVDHLEMLIDWLNDCRKSYVEQKHKEDWWQMIQLLPSSYNQRRTLDFNYETAVQIIRQRTGYKLDEWHTFVDVLLNLPYMREIMNGQTGYGCGWVD